MTRNLDITALRSFAAVADSGGVTRAAGALNLTQSAVSMQLKRLEEALGQSLLDRAGRGVALTAQGELLLSYARRMIALNDEALERLTEPNWEGEIALGAPHDVVYPHIPDVLAHFARAFPRVRVRLISSYTVALLEDFRRGAVDLMLTTESSVGPGGETLQESPLVWAGAPGGKAWRERPLKLAFEKGCIFRPFAQRALDEAGIDWNVAVESESTRAIEASVSADLGVHAGIRSGLPPQFEVIDHHEALPALPSVKINLYARREGPKAALIARLAEAIRAAYGAKMRADAA